MRLTTGERLHFFHRRNPAYRATADDVRQVNAHLQPHLAYDVVERLLGDRAVERIARHLPVQVHPG
jgi:hypothetical protein